MKETKYTSEYDDSPYHVEQVRPENIEKDKSQWGHMHYIITEYDIAYLRSGGLLNVDDGEYSHYIELGTKVKK